jgi:hypothetical protein
MECWLRSRLVEHGRGQHIELPLVEIQRIEGGPIAVRQQRKDIDIRRTCRLIRQAIRRRVPGPFLADA